MELELIKVIVQAVVLEREDGQVTGERITEPIALFTVDQLAAFIPKLQAEIDEENSQ